MVEPLKELNRICQKPRYREAGNWMVRNILRDAALPVTWLLLHTSVTANQVTLISLIIGLIGICFFALPASGAFLFGAFLLQLWYYLDHVDGQIARYRKTASLTGRFFDFMTHHLIHGLVFFFLALFVYQSTGAFLFVLWGFFASIAMMMFNLINDTKAKTYLEKIMMEKKVNINNRTEKADTGKEAHRASSLRQTFSWLHKVCEIHVLMNILTAAALLECFVFRGFQSRTWLFLFYGAAVPFIAIVKTSYLIVSSKIDEDFKSRFYIE